jgi:membrane associated rhomboid family serine protease/Zn-finger nucleic acid-binding protein
MLVCQECQLPLAATRDRGDAEWICPKCRARVIALATLERLLAADFVRSLRETIERGPAGAGESCPSCHRTMREVVMTVNSVESTIDACRGCGFVQLAAGVFEQLPRKPRYDASSAAPLARALAVGQVELDEELRRERRRWSDDLDSLSWPRRILLCLGLPVDADAADLLHPPWATSSLAAALVVAFLVQNSGGEFTRELAWIPSHPFRLGGITLLTSFFLHGSWLHLLGNLYFLILFGSGVEGRIGAARTLVLLAVATVAGNVAHALLDPRSDVPCIGASGGLSALILFYAAAFPWNRFAIVFWVWFTPKTLVVPAVLWVALWVVWQLGVAFLQHFGGGSISGLAHLGGAVTGIGAWLAWRRSASAAK